jgi:hypothetical protein
MPTSHMHGICKVEFEVMGRNGTCQVDRNVRWELYDMTLFMNSKVTNGLFPYIPKVILEMFKKQ